MSKSFLGYLNKKMRRNIYVGLLVKHTPCISHPKGILGLAVVRLSCCFLSSLGNASNSNRKETIEVAATRDDT